MSRGELEVLRRLVEPAGEDGIRTREPATEVTGEQMAEAGLSPREVRELRAKLESAPRPDFDLDLTRMRPAEEVADEMARAVPEVDRNGGGA